MMNLINVFQSLHNFFIAQTEKQFYKKIILGSNSF